MSWFESPSRRMVMRLSLSVQLIDDLTGAPVRGSNARVWIEGQKPAIVKPDGRYVFVDVPEGEYTVNAEGGLYSRVGIGCRISADRAENITLRLLPNRQYPVPDDAVCIEGKTAPDTAVRIYSTDKTAAYKLLSDARKGSSVIGIYHAAGLNLEGKLLRIISPKDKGEYIRIMSAKNEERSEYQLSGELGGAFPKIGTVIVPVSECVSDGKGDFMLLLRKGSLSGTELICSVQTDKGETEKKIAVSESNYIKSDLTV